ncbi:PoNe immunity protein domain-containing protein [Pseudoduganella buxea]|uniref:PoNi C-terminal domain-containing protein n=2 Tax=Pseudoduganella buxea TaxID=1949069 RepID=A0ABQ1KHL7_9BURK|nr:PoNe immunity protein domain-containing protein [Pseudoduganella buxea]GGB96078.1 hypothetical protein GCM10011572_17580 [Pseudoduganella buxea]
MQKLDIDKFGKKKREKLLDFEVYDYNFDDLLTGFEVVRKTLSRPDYISGEIGKYKASVPAKQRAWDSLNFLATAYSGGDEVAELAKFFPAVLQYWESFSDAWIALDQSEQGAGSRVAILPLMGTEYVFANQIICLAILTGWAKLLNKIPRMLDFNNPCRDGMLERLLHIFLPDRDELPSECTRHLPYFKTIRIFDAPQAARPALMKEYLEDWYEASRREGYYNSHMRGDVFTGYWSWEAAAITFVLDIDDSSFRDAMFNPVDLVDYARGINAPKSSRYLADNVELPEKSGQPCPKAGRWETLDIPPQQRQFKYGEILQASDAAYGITVWRYLDAT